MDPSIVRLRWERCTTAGRVEVPPIEPAAVTNDSLAMPSSPFRNGVSDPIFLAEGVSVAMDSTPILKNIDFTIRRGRLVGLLGPNGSGKSTLMRAASGLLPYEGRLTFDGREVAGWTAGALARRLAFVRQTTSLSFDFSVSELVLLGRSPHKGWLQGYTVDDTRQARLALRQVDMEGFAERSVLTLSGGELQRVMLAQALVQEADMLLLDEPTAHLDVHYQYEFMDLVRALVGQGRTVMTVFHDLEMAARYADEVIVLSGGGVAACGSPAHVLTDDLIARVFRMRAALHTSQDGVLRIEFLAPIRQDAHSYSA